MSTAYFLTFAGVYKAARLSLRSGIENAFRIQALSGGYDVGLLLTIPELVEAAKLSARTEKQRERIGLLYGIYGELCQTVHSVSINYMGLRVPFEKIVQYDPSEANANFDVLVRVIRKLDAFLFIEFYEKIAILDFRNADIVRDAVEPSVKAEALELSV